MKDIIFHIGHPKCASTTLQNRVFINEKSYLGTAKTMPNNLAKKLQRISPVGPSITWSKNKTRQWADEVREFSNLNCIDETPLIASSEMYANRNKFKERPIIPFLKYFSRNIWTEGEVKIVMVIRNQFERLASEYAQVSVTNIKASQYDFERYIDNHIKQNNKHLDYVAWVSDLYESFSKDQVCVLLMEDIQTKKFWEELKFFCELKNFEVETMFSNNANSSSRKSSKHTWKLRPFSSEEKAKVKVNNYMRLLWPQSIAVDLRASTNLKLRNLLSKSYKSKSEYSKSVRGDEIVLTEELKSKLLEYYKPSNIALGHLLNRDLSEVNYY
ncbi:sulfotransferase domain-containing protein [Psychroflexus aestuariivivens]|uniref:sulfotransferase domain-containing protein n=1 Tax=Psychroflexus aestuariivivens TaxID=1795040 RepID=UPI000FD9CD40|nr:sulfotransferase domain-containing protein [Psychroflexus aestuariivivens]